MSGQISTQEVAPPTNPELVAAMQAVAHDDNPHTRRVLYETLLKSWLLVPTAGSGQSTDPAQVQTTTEEQRVAPVTIHGPEGEPIVPAFTDPGALLLWAPGGNDYETLKAQSLFELALDNDVHSILVNPAGPTGGQITRAEMVVLAQGVIPEGFGQGVPTPWSYTEGSQVLIAAPANLPSEGFFALLREAMEHFPAITEGYLALTIWGGGEPHLTVGVGLSSPADEQIVKAMFSALTRAVQPALPENRHVNFLVLGDDEIAEAIRNLQIVVFRRD